VLPWCIHHVEPRQVRNHGCEKEWWALQESNLLHDGAASPQLVAEAEAAETLAAFAWCRDGP
jgi:hypothetical protein